MSIRTCILITFLFCAYLVKAQVVNYVNNPSFELTAGSMNAPFNDAKYWSPLDSMQCGSYYLVGMPPYGNAPNFTLGFQYPKTGKFFIESEFFCNICLRWYPRNRLKQSLKPNKTYCAKYYIVNTNNNQVAIENYGMYFGGSSMDTIKKCSVPLSYLTPQIEYSGPIITDTLRWIPISGTFVATGTEKYMLLGNFRSNAMTNTLVISTTTTQPQGNAIYLDDVSLIEMDLPAFAGRDTVMHPGDSVFIGRESDIGIDEACIWYKLPDMTNPIDTIAGFWIKPTNTATYVVKQQLWCTNTPKWDTVVVQASIYVGHPEFKMLNFELDLFPNPANNFLELKIKDLNLKTYFNRILIYNNLGQSVKEVAIANGFRTNLSTEIRIEDLPEGIYTLQLSDSSGTVSKRFVISR